MSDELIDILLVDDEPRNLEALDAILEGRGYRLLHANGADRALHLLLEHPIAAMVLDIKMPGVSGVELAKIIKGTRKFRQIPIVFLTAHMLEDQDVIAGYGAGAVDYLTKPVHPEILRHKIAVFAELFRKTRALAELNETLEERVQERTAELERSEAALRESSQQKDQFLAILAHELRNPLAPLRTGLDLLLQAPMQTQSSPVRRTLAAMNRQLDHMVRLIDDLLDVSRINRGTFELKREQLDLVSVIDRAVETSRPFFVQREHSLTVAATSPVYASVDPTRIAQVLGNLLHNAAKYTRAGGNVRIELTREGDDAKIRVIDSGLGIPPEQLGRVFEMFSRINRALPDSDRGLGIGLALARKLAEMHGGTLAASSSGDGHGTTFTLTLPSTSAGISTPLEAPQPRQKPSANLSMLVIEDNEDAAETLALWLEAQGHEVQLANTGEVGLELLQSGHPDIVLCDIGLPGISGIEVCERVHGLPLDRRPIMVALSGWGMAEDRRRTKDAGFDHHLVKPVGADQLFELLETVRTVGMERLSPPDRSDVGSPSDS